MDIRRHVWVSTLTVAAILLLAQPALAGMPAPYRLSQLSQLRLEAISFFLGVLLASAALIRWVWNGLRHSVGRLPHLSYGKAVGLVVLWGLLFTIVLTMIAGARELMTPGAWERQGATYKLKPPEQPR